MTDKELLEAAARAAGLPTFASGATGLRVASDGCKSGYIWNPLTDDGDALRLAVKFEMLVDFMQLRVVAGQFEPEVFVDFEDGEYRRAIVRAASEIGSSHNAAADPRSRVEQPVLPKQTTKD